MPATLKTDKLQNLSGTVGVDVTNLATNGRYIRQIVQCIDSINTSTSTGWTLGTTFGDYTGFKAGSTLKIYYMYPVRNDSTSWGGAYFEPQIRFNGDKGVWQSLGSRGYDGVMLLNYATIHHTHNTMYIDPGQTNDFSVSIRYWFRSYDGTLNFNLNNRDVNVISGTASLMPGVNGQQHYGRFLIEEYALIKGAGLV
jgi:hypothetical protein